MKLKKKITKTVSYFRAILLFKTYIAFVILAIINCFNTIFSVYDIHALLSFLVN